MPQVNPRIAEVALESIERLPMRRLVSGAYRQDSEFCTVGAIAYSFNIAPEADAITQRIYDHLQVIAPGQVSFETIAQDLETLIRLNDAPPGEFVDETPEDRYDRVFFYLSGVLTESLLTAA